MQDDFRLKITTIMNSQARVTEKIEERTALAKVDFEYGSQDYN